MPQRTLTAWLCPPAGSAILKKNQMRKFRVVSEPVDKSGKNYSHRHN